MRAEAAVIRGAGRVEVIDINLPDPGPREVLIEVVSSGMCLSTTKALTLGATHKRVPDDVAENPVMTGHEFAGRVVEVGSELRDRYAPGESVVIQPAMGLDNGYSPGYSYPYYGGDTTYTIVPEVAVDKGCILHYDGTYFGAASLAEPMMCIIGAFHASYHTENFVYEHQMGIRAGGRLALLGAGGAMGIGAIDYALHGPYAPEVIVAVDTDAGRIARLAELFDAEEAAARGTRLVLLDSTGTDLETALQAAVGGRGFDDVFVMAAVPALIEAADAVMATDGCLNFFAGPTDKDFSANMNFYSVHYERTHVVGTSGGNAADMAEGIALTEQGRINPSKMVSHVTGLADVPRMIRDLPEYRAGKVIAYPHVEFPVTAISELRERAAADPRFVGLADICDRHAGIWSEEAERYLLKTFGGETGPAAVER